MSDDHITDPELADLEATLRELDADDLTFVEPPDDLWDRIARDIGSDGDATVTSLASRRRTFAQRTLLLVAAVVLLVAGAVVVAGVVRDGDATVLATAELGFEPGFDAAGTSASARVSLIESDDRLELAFDRASLPSTADQDADLELWLIETDADGNIVDLVSLGVVDATDRTFAVPAGYDPAAYDVVDISVEPHDGDASHSGRSILRGQLSA